jgi:hypothetical protein
MKRITATLIAFIIILSCLTLLSCDKKSGLVVEIGDQTVTMPSEVTNVSYTAAESLECNYTDDDGIVYDLFSANRDTFVKLSQKSHETKYSVLADKQELAYISAAIFAENFPDKGIVYDGCAIAIRANTTAKAIVCIGKGNDGGYAALAIDKGNGSVISILYSEPEA